MGRETMQYIVTIEMYLLFTHSPSELAFRVVHTEEYIIDTST